MSTKAWSCNLGVIVAKSLERRDELAQGQKCAPLPEGEPLIVMMGSEPTPMLPEEFAQMQEGLYPWE